MGEPPVIITQATSVSKQIKTRARTVFINNPVDADPRIEMGVENLLMLDGKVVSALPDDSTEVPKIKQVTRPFSTVQTTLITITDPVSNQSVTISVAGIASAIQQVFCDWYAADAAAQ